MYRMVASDMDETFLGTNHRIPRANIDATATCDDGVIAEVWERFCAGA